MENTLQPSLPSFRHKITTIEAIELAIIGFLFWGLVVILPSETTKSPMTLLIFLLMTQGILLGSWVIYNVYIRIARSTGRALDIGIWVLASALTGTYTFWAWIILDINRWIVARLLYVGDAPVEYAFSWRSKQVRRLWEESRKTQ